VKKLLVFWFVTKNTDTNTQQDGLQ